MAGLEQVSGNRDCFTDTTVRGAGGLAHLHDQSSADSTDDCGSLPVPQDIASRLAQTIEADIIPRLLLAHRIDLRATARTATLDAGSVERLVRMVMSGDVSEALAEVDALRAGQHSLETIYLDLLAPAARRLGDMWMSDECSFASVTLGLGGLQQVLRHYGRAFEDEPSRQQEPVGRILLANCPGEQHSFGVLMLEEFFRRANWDVTCLTEGNPSEIIQISKTNWFTAVGFSISVQERLAPLSNLIRETRKSSRNKNMFVLVGGRCILDNPDRVHEVGADGTAVDGREAISQIQTMIKAAANQG